MYLIVGLGNPGREYEGTRHNAGFLVVDRLADKLGVSVSTRKFLGFTGSSMLGGEKILLLKPQTYMNASGESVRAAVDYYKLEPEQVIVVYDERQRRGAQRDEEHYRTSGYCGVSPCAGWDWRQAAGDGSGRLCAEPFSEK